MLVIRGNCIAAPDEIDKLRRGFEGGGYSYVIPFFPMAATAGIETIDCIVHRQDHTTPYYSCAGNKENSIHFFKFILNTSGLVHFIRADERKCLEMSLFGNERSLLGHDMCLLGNNSFHLGDDSVSVWE